MLGIAETADILHRFLKDCFEFWITECDKKEAWARAIADTEDCDSDPYEGKGKFDRQTKSIFIKYYKEYRGD